MDIIEKLNLLADLRSAPDAIRMQKQAIIDTILTPEIRAQLAEIDAEFAPKLEAAETAAATLEAEIKAEVVQGGKSVKAAHLQAVWNKGRDGGWNGEKLAGYSAAHPEILPFKNPDGKPSCTIRGV